MIRQIKSPLQRLVGTTDTAKTRELNRVIEQNDRLMLLAGKNLAWQIPARGILPSLSDAEFSVFSQFGDDGIIQYLVHHLQVEPRTFIEFGVENYTESNTRFLLMNNQWRGLVIDGSKENVDHIKSDTICWKYQLTAVESFITAENINTLFRENSFSGEIGLLSIDVDGVDYWIWKAIHSVNPVVVVTEFNAVFGPEHTVSVPYSPTFVRREAHYSNIYWGASLNAFCDLANERGYAFVGTSSAGQNAYFVRRDKLGPLRELTSREGFTDASFRDSRDQAGRLTFLSGADRLREIADMPVVDVRTGTALKVKDLAR